NRRRVDPQKRLVAQSFVVEVAEVTGVAYMVFGGRQKCLVVAPGQLASRFQRTRKGSLPNTSLFDVE
ncbi:MAG: hypothetical protein KDA84_09780, partial [Planctomycetaceae bacterium]|nr:hypothetical protein [Planctomycetaceae bacterium]